MTDETAMPGESIAPRSRGSSSSSKRTHRATYSRDKRKGGYLVRVQGPTAERFANREVPVTMRDGTEHTEKLERLIWTGKDNETGDPVALYTFESRPREDEDEATF